MFVELEVGSVTEVGTMAPQVEQQLGDRAGAGGGVGVVYTPWFWRWIMLLIRHLPERLFVRTRL